MKPLVIQLAKAIQEGASFEDVTRDCIFAALILCGGNKDKAAKRIRLDPRTLRSKVDRYEIEKNPYCRQELKYGQSPLFEHFEHEHE